MPITKSVNSKANVKENTNNDLPFSPQQPVIASYYATTAAGQTTISLPFSIVASGSSANTDIFWLFIDGKKLDLGSGNDYTFTSIASDGTSSTVTLNAPQSAGLNIQAFKLGLKKESEFQTDNRFVNLYEYLSDNFQGCINPNEFLITATSTAGTPAAGTFYSSITGRASITDLSQNLKPQMGIERIMTQQIYQVQNEFGPNGEQVWATPNDLFGQIRYVGAWTNDVGTNGQRISSGAATDFIEVTFYGTGLNILLGLSGAGFNITATVDGGASGSNIVPASYAGTLQARNYSSNLPISVVSGLTLGIHTVKLTYTVGTATTYGFEILNESSSVKTAPGVGYIKGQKYVASALNSFSYSAPATGTRGGRVLVYQNSDGSIGQAFQAVNASQANLAAADHTNEEAIRKHHFREFGAGRSDDFSTLTSALSTRTFTLDDGTVSLAGNNVAINGTFNQEGVLLTSTLPAFLMFTFVGTGLDWIAGSDTADTTNYSVTVDGSSVGNLSLSVTTTPRQYKIVSGLPYGTHVVKISRTAGSTTFSTMGMVVYQPKKPSLPAGSIELADYNVMANYVANATADPSNNGFIGTGLLRKTSARELTYVGTWAISVDSGEPTFTVVSTSTNGSYFQYTFFGTGFELRNEALTTGSATNTVALQNLTTGGSLLTLNSTNFPGLTTSSYGGDTFTYSTGNLSIATSNNTGSGFTVSGLPLGLYTLRITNGTSSSFRFGCLDVITPIHSIKANIYSDLQNTLSVGSNAISDNRQTTPVKQSLPATKAWAQALGVTSSPTTTSTSFIPAPDMSCTVKTSGGPLRISYSIDGFNTASGNALFYQIYVDGVAIGSQKIDTPSATTQDHIASDTFKVPVSPGVHKVDVYWKVSSGTGTLDGTNRNMLVEET